MGWVATGITIDFVSGFMAEIIDVTPPNMSREMVDMSHQGTSKWRKFKPGKLIDPGEAEASIAFLPSEIPPMADDFQEVTITFPDSGGTTWKFDGALGNYGPGAELEGKATADVTIKASGPISINDSPIT